MYRLRTLLFATCLLLLADDLSLCAQTLFQNIISTETGIYFNNKVVDTREANILIYSNYYGGAGVGLADFDNDGLCDIYFAGNLVGDKIYRNEGDLKFKDVTLEAGIVDNGEWSSSVVLGDLNNDNLIDIYITSELYDEQPERRKNRLYINKGNFRFVEMAEEYGLASTERTRGATFIDYNRDGWLDIYLLNQPPNPGNYSNYHGQKLLRKEWSPRLYVNEQNGHFKDVTTEAGLLRPCYPNSAIAADFNNDGWQDLYVSNDYEAPDFFYINNGDGTFRDIAPEALRHMSYYAMGVDAADINNDGLTDLMTLDMVAEDNFRQKANMGGMYPEAFWKLVAAGGHYQYMFNALQLNQGHDVYSDIAQLANVSNTDWSWSNLIADFDNDGWKDIYVTNGLLRDIRNSDAAKTFPEYVRGVANDFLKNNPNVGDVHILDIMDLEEALLLIPSIPIANYVFQNMGSLQFENKSQEWGVDLPSFSNGSAYADLDNDGDLELVINNINAEAFVFKNLSTEQKSGYYLQVQLKDESGATIQGAKIEIHQGKDFQMTELLSTRGMYSSSQMIGHFGLKSMNPVKIKITWPDQTRQTELINAVNKKVVISKNKSSTTGPSTIISNLATHIIPGLSDHVHVENKFDDYEVQVLLPHEMSHQGPAMEVADLNGDGLEDVVIGGARGQRSTIFFQSTDGNFDLKYLGTASDSIYEDVDVAIFDANGDGQLDIYVASGGNSFAPRNRNYLDRLYINEGGPEWKKCESCIPRLLESASVVRPFDFDQDGDLDLFIGGRHQPWDYPSPTISRLLENNNGTFSDVTKTLAKDLINIGMVTDALWTDYDKDGLQDIILVGEWMPVTFVKQSTSGFQIDDQISISSEEEGIKSNGWWSSIAEITTQDNLKKYVLGNLGLNYKYKASLQEPFSLYYNDFDQNGKKDIVLSYYNFGKEYPLRGRSCSAEQIPGLKKDFPTYDLFASSDISSVYNPLELEKSLCLQTYEFGHVELMQSTEDDDQFTISKLPIETQISTVNSILYEDLDQDGSKDLVLAGNMYQAEIETPRNDGGVGSILKWDETTNEWMSIPAAESGIYMAYDIRKLRTITIQNNKYILGAVNNGPIQIWKLENYKLQSPSP